MLETAAVLNGNGYGENRKAMQEIRRAVERVDDPDELVASAAATFLAEKAVVGMRPADRLDDLALRHVVDFAHEVVAALRAHTERRNPVDVANDQVAGASGRGSSWKSYGWTRKVKPLVRLSPKPAGSLGSR